jgi:hypothetical protein
LAVDALEAGRAHPATGAAARHGEIATPAPTATEINDDAAAVSAGHRGRGSELACASASDRGGDVHQSHRPHRDAHQLPPSGYRQLDFAPNHH